jgi:hypothetical protein
VFVFAAGKVSLRGGGGSEGKEKRGEFVACWEAILISMSRDQPGLLEVEGDGGQRDRVLESRNWTKYSSSHKVISVLQELSSSLDFTNA